MLFRWDHFDSRHWTFYERKKEILEFLHKTIRRIEDHWQFDYLSYLWFEPVVKDNQIWISLLHGYLLQLFYSLDDSKVIWDTEYIAYLIRKWLDYYDIGTEIYNYELEYYLWLAMHYEVNLYIYEDSVDFDTLLGVNQRRVAKQFLSSPCISFSVSKYRTSFDNELIKIKHFEFKLLGDTEKQILNEVSIAEKKNASSVTVQIKKWRNSWKAIWIHRERELDASELENIHETARKIYFWEIAVRFKCGGIISGTWKKKIRFDKSIFIDMQ